LGLRSLFAERSREGGGEGFSEKEEMMSKGKGEGESFLRSRVGGLLCGKIVWKKGFLGGIALGWGLG